MVKFGERQLYGVFVSIVLGIQSGGLTASDPVPSQKADQEEADRARQDLSSGSSEERAAAAHRLGVLGASDAAPDLIGLLNDESSEVQYFALVALEMLDVEGLVPHVRALLVSRDPKVQVTAASILLGSADKRSVPKVLALLESPSPFVRQSIIRSLGVSRTTESVPALLRLLRTSDRDVRCWVLSALGEIAARSSADTVAGFLENPDNEIRRAAVAAVARIDGPRFRRQLREALASDSSRVQAAARAGLARISDPVARNLVRAAGEFELLNYYRSPETCAVLDATRIERKLIRRQPVGQIVRVIAEQTDLKVEISSSVESKVLTARYGSNSELLGPSPTATSILLSLNPQFMESPIALTFVVDEDRVRILAIAEAKSLWADWTSK